MAFKSRHIANFVLLIGVSSGLSACLFEKRTDSTSSSAGTSDSGTDTGSGSDSGSGTGTDTGSGTSSGTGSSSSGSSGGGSSIPTLAISDLASNPSHAGTSLEAYASACTTSTQLTSMNSGTAHSYYDILTFSTSGAWSYSRLWYEGTNCYTSYGDSNSNSIDDGDNIIKISMGGSASIGTYISDNKFSIQFNNTSGSSLQLTYQVIKNWYTGACTNGPSFTYSSNSAETRTMNGIDCTPWGDFPSTAGGDDGKLYNVIQKVSDSVVKLGAFPNDQMGPGINKSLGNLNTATTPTVTFTRYTY